MLDGLIGVVHTAVNLDHIAPSDLSALEPSPAAYGLLHFYLEHFSMCILLPKELEPGQKGALIRDNTVHVCKSNMV